jgi:hypothetical protein
MLPILFLDRDHGSLEEVAETISKKGGCLVNYTAETILKKGGNLINYTAENKTPHYIMDEFVQSAH